MSYIRRAFLTCNKCGTTVECDAVNDNPFSIAARPDPAVAGWRAIDGLHHLCPSCAAVYAAKEEEFERELRRLRGDEIA